jgi:hypothetical protein
VRSQRFSMFCRSASLAGVILVGILGTAVSVMAQTLKDVQTPDTLLVLKAQGSFFVGGEKVEQTQGELGDFGQMLSPAEIGARGNSHMIMQDKNHLQVADLILKWIDERGDQMIGAASSHRISLMTNRITARAIARSSPSSSAGSPRR